MTRPIDADDFVRDLAEWYVKESPMMSGCGDQAVADMIWEFIKAVNKRPTIDAAPVVRCKDCVYGRPYNKVWYQPKKDSFYCLKNEAEKDENWFCADGKKVTE